MRLESGYYLMESNEIIKVVHVHVEEIPKLHTLGKITLDDGTVVYSGKAQWENEPKGVYFPVGVRFTPEFLEHIDMVGCFGEHNTVSPKTFGKYLSEGFLVPFSVVEAWGKTGKNIYA